MSTDGACKSLSSDSGFANDLTLENATSPDWGGDVHWNSGWVRASTAGTSNVLIVKGGPLSYTAPVLSCHDPT